VSTGALRLENPYSPGVYSVFKDWKAHGAVNVEQALAVSSDEYFYYLGGGFGKQQGLGIDRIDKYMTMFGFGLPTGIALSGEKSGNIPSQKWKAETFPDDPTWRVGDTYHTSIGQYGFQVTPLQIVRAVASLANGGLLLTPRIDANDTPYGARTLDLPTKHYVTVRAGMRDSVLYGTAVGLNAPYVEIAAKTGTAELGVSKEFVNSWVMGYFPYKSPRYAFAVVMEHGPRGNVYGATFVMRQFMDWLHEHAPEYLSSS
jgi:penicillin-binding protein 2